MKGVRDDRRARSSSAARLKPDRTPESVLEGFVERLFLAPTLVASAIVLMRFAFRIGNHFGFSDGADDNLQGYDANFGGLLDERYPFRVIRLPYNILLATRPSAVFPSLDRVGS